MAHLLLELLSEEIPASMQRGGAEQLGKGLCDVLARRGMTPDDTALFSTPRRIAVLLSGIPSRLPPSTETIRGPRHNAPAAALDGFLRKYAVTKNQLTRQGEFYILSRKQMADPLPKYLTAHLPDMIRHINWPKSMHWGTGAMRWVRPLRNILCLLDGQVVRLELDGLVSNNQLYGHRFLAPQPKRLAHAKAYEAQLKQQYVLAKASARRAALKSQLDRKKPPRTRVLTNEALLEDVTGLVEWPCVLVGHITPKFQSLPMPLLRNVLERHQRYICLAGARGKITHYAVIANHFGKDKGQTILHNNANVLGARLLDAEFFIEQDLKRGLDDMAKALQHITFYKNLGTLADRSQRLSRLAGAIAHQLDSTLGEAVATAGRLCKADLVSDVVREFPDLQGLMGSYYVGKTQLAQKAIIAAAIAEHYAPRGAKDGLPRARAGIILAIAERLDMLAGFWSLGMRPTSTKDPYALRRAALGLIRIFVDHALPFDIGDWFEEALSAYKTDSKAQMLALRKDFIAFMRERLASYLREQKSLRADVFAALTHYEMISLRGAESLNLSHTVMRAQALQKFLHTPNGRHLLVAYKRAVGILQDEGVSLQLTASMDKLTFPQAAAQSLYQYLIQVKTVPGSDATYEKDLGLLSRLRAPLDKFFDTVFVNAPDKTLRARYHQLLVAVVNKIQDYAGDLSRIDASVFVKDK